MTRPHKPRLGQHFLTDPNILRRIVDALEGSPGETIVEIGPGHGDLTRVLAARGFHVVAIERDVRLAAELREAGRGKGEGYNVSVVAGDALDEDWHAHAVPFPLPASPFPRFKVIGNIPYYITTPLIEKALTPPLPERIVFLVQQEVAQRVAAAPGSKQYGALSVGVQAACRVELLFSVAPGAFRPPPKVRSALLRLTPLAEPLVAPEEAAALRRFVTGCFSRRRKQLRNAVPATLRERLGDLGVDPAARPETLAPAEFVRLLRAAPQL